MEQDSNVSVEQLLQSRRKLSRAERRRCVGYLKDTGTSVEEMAQKLKVTTRTIRRDLRRLKQEEISLVETMDDIREVLGSLIGLAESLKEKARRGVARAKNGSPAQASFLKLQWQIENELLERLKELGVIAPELSADKEDYEGIEPSKAELISGILSGRIPTNKAKKQGLAS